MFPLRMAYTLKYTKSEKINFLTWSYDGDSDSP